MADRGLRNPGLFNALAVVALILGLAYTVTGIAGLLRDPPPPAAGVLTGFGVAVSGLAVWLRRFVRASKANKASRASK
ncbi:MAG TPA: hypothetical protein VFL88_03320 [Gemmatimonadales bacterium]|nr:hypothetical protein [Gemmatimonadales bacterium]